MKKIKSSKAKKLTFFTAGHGLYHFDISQDTFDNSLYMNLLFFSTGLAWSDHFFLQGNYVTNHLYNHRKTPGDSWIEAGLRENRIIPFFRGEPSFVASDGSMKKQQLKGLHPDSRYLAERFDAVAGEYGSWPSFMIAERYYQKLKDYFQSDNPYWFGKSEQEEYSDIGRIWNGMKSWGLEDIEKGLRRTERKNGHGVQVSEIINATVHRFMKREVDGINTVDKLFALLKENKVHDNELYSLHVFYSLIMHVYNQNLAISIDTKPNSPITNAHIFAAQSFRKKFAVGSMVPTFIEFKERNSPVTSVSISLPSLKVLRNTPGTTLRRIWNTNAATDYFNALKSWRKKPLQQNARENLSIAAIEYSKIINNCIESDVNRQDYELETLNTTSDILGVLASTASTAFIQLTDLPAETKLGISLSAPVAAYSIKRAAKRILSRRSLPKQNMELNFVPAQKANRAFSIRDMTDISPFE